MSWFLIIDFLELLRCFQAYLNNTLRSCCLTVRQSLVMMSLHESFEVACLEANLRWATLKDILIKKQVKPYNNRPK